MKKTVKKVKTQKDTMGYMDLRRRATTHRDVLGERVPIRKITNVRHRGATHGIRDISRITWEPWEQEVAKNTHQLEKQRLGLANRFYIALAKIQSMLKDIQQRNEELQTTTEELHVTNEESRPLTKNCRPLQRSWTVLMPNYSSLPTSPPTTCRNRYEWYRVTLTC